jgi:hypothetical protein
MSNTNFASQVGSGNNYTAAQKQKLFIGTHFNPGSPIPYKTATVSAAVTSGATTLTVGTGGFNVKLFEGTIIALKTAVAWETSTIDTYFSTYYVVSAEVAAATTAIPIESTTQTAPATTEARIYSWLPYFSANSYTISDQTNTITELNFSAGLSMEQVATDTTGSAEMSGAWVFDDPALAEIAANRGKGRQFFFTAVYPQLRGGDYFIGGTSSASKSSERAAWVQQQQSLFISGEYYNLNALTATAPST